MAPTNWREPEHGDYIISNFLFKDGKSLPELKIHYRTLGTLKRDSKGIASNAVLILHGSTGNGGALLTDTYAGVLFNRGQLLSAEEYFLIFPDNIGHGQSTKPSDGLRARFPRYCYNDMVQAQHLLVTQHLGVNHLRLVIGGSMGGMHAWMWAVAYPDFMDAVMPIQSLPCQISGRNRMFRKHMIESIRNSPDFNDGEFGLPPSGLRTAMNVMYWTMNSPLQVQKRAPDWESADKLIDKFVEAGLKDKNANDFAYAFDASWDYDPRPGLARIEAALTAVNSADDELNPPELKILETETKKVKFGKAVVLPITDKTDGHATLWLAECWKEHLAELLDRSAASSKAKL